MKYVLTLTVQAPAGAYQLRYHSARIVFYNELRYRRGRTHTGAVKLIQRIIDHHEPLPLCLPAGTIGIASIGKLGWWREFRAEWSVIIPESELDDWLSFILPQNEFSLIDE